MKLTEREENTLVISRQKKNKNQKKSIFEIYRSKKTIEDYMFYLKNFLNYIYENENEISADEIVSLMNSIDKKDVDDYIVHLFEDRKLKKTSINKIISAMKSLYKELEKSGLNNPFKHIKLFKVSRNIDNVLKVSANDIENIIKNYEIKGEKDYRNILILYTLFYTGLRSQELLNIKYKDITKREDNYYVTLEETKSGKAQYKPLHSLLIDHIQEYSEYLRKVYNITEDELQDYYLFCSDFSKNKKLSYRSLNDLIKKMGLTIGKDISPHNIRHAIATELSLNGADLLEIKDFLGHSDTRVTEIYINAKSILEKKVLEKIPELKKD